MTFLKCASVIALMSISALASGTTSAQADLIWGVNGHPFTAYPGISMDRQLDFVKDLGMRSYRVNISRATSAPALAELVRGAKARNIAILPVITPALDLDNSSPQQLYAAAHNLAVTLVSQFKNDIRIWELGNELENYAIIKACEIQDDGVQYNCGWGPAGGTGMLHYYGPRWAKVSAVLKGLSEGTIAVDPTIRKAVGTAGWGHTGAFLRMLEDGIKWDISVWHHYEGDPEKAFKFLATLGRPIWVTEFNHSRGSESGEDAQAQGLIQMMTYLRQYRRTYNVEGAHIYELMDEPYWAPSFEAVMGLVRMVKVGPRLWRPGDPKPAYYAVKKFIAADGITQQALVPSEARSATRSGAAPASPTIAPPAQMPARMSTVAVPPALPVPRQCDLRSFDHSGSTPENQVAYSYCLILGRPVDGAGNQTYVTAIKGGQSILRVLEELLNSHEFGERYAAASLGNVEYVTLLYRLLLHREPDGSGLRSYVSQLDAGKLTRSVLQQELIASSEFQKRQAILFSGSSRGKTR
jgi:Domain of unknown function (DUF4214)/Glycosyl hydrolase catalytic core